ncbi:RidA family protein [Pseudonocardia sp. EC080625-04]|uniref:RidA family protein n=1 Tax=Pseudonocardia sp. EC080625-04 TaxID=1096868 RepID=UPI001EE7714C|nr:RidA family protein [Pseudonocardia sp. EC080625-04]
MIQTDRAPAPAGAYSQAVATDRLVFVSGQTPRSTSGERLLDAPFDEQVRAALSNLAAVAEASGTSLGQALYVTVFLRDPSNAPHFDAIYRTFVGTDPPARTLVPSALTIGEVEINAVLAR